MSASATPASVRWILRGADQDAQSLTFRVTPGHPRTMGRATRADFIALDTRSPRLVPLHRESLSNLYSTVAYSACGADVCDMAVNGSWVMQDRDILTMDCDEVRTNAQEASEYLVLHAKRQA